MIMMMCATLHAQEAEMLTTVEKVDIERYAGLWYEVAKIPNKFQKSCDRNTTAEYSVAKDGKVIVVNTCIRKNGSINVARGIAKVANETNTKLRVSFVKLLGIHLFYGDYWVIGLDPEYRWAIVGEPSRKYGWVLGRSSTLGDDDWTAIKSILKSKGYDFNDFQMSVHN